MEIKNLVRSKKVLLPRSEGLFPQKLEMETRQNSNSFAIRINGNASYNQALQELCGFKTRLRKFSLPKAFSYVGCVDKLFENLSR